MIMQYYINTYNNNALKVWSLGMTKLGGFYSNMWDITRNTNTINTEPILSFISYTPFCNKK